MRKQNILKTFATNVAFSFCFTAIFVLIVFFIFNKKINYYSSLINTTAINTSIKKEQKDTSLDLNKKRLINYPDYGSKYATIEIEKINLKLPVYHGDSLSILRHGVGHYAGSYFPGEGGTTILAAHNSENFFGNITLLKKGDRIVLDTTYGMFTYEVDNYKVVNEKDLSAFGIEHDNEKLIMYTCYPTNTLGNKTERYVVYAYKVGDNND